jgi:hypothetical protein
MPPLEPSTRVRAIVATAACVAALGLAACGGGDEESTVTTTGAEATETTTTSEAETTSPTGSTTTSGGDADIDVGALREQFNEQLRGVLTAQQGLTPSQADCAVEELQDSLTDEALRKVAETGQAPKDLIDAAFDAGVACKDK